MNLQTNSIYEATKSTLMLTASRMQPAVGHQYKASYLPMETDVIQQTDFN